MFLAVPQCITYQRISAKQFRSCIFPMLSSRKRRQVHLLLVHYRLDYLKQLDYLKESFLDVVNRTVVDNVKIVFHLQLLVGVSIQQVCYVKQLIDDVVPLVVHMNSLIGIAKLLVDDLRLMFDNSKMMTSSSVCAP